MRAFKSRIKDKINEFYLGVDQRLDHIFKTKLTQIRLNLENYGQDANLLEKIKEKILLDKETESLLKDFNRLGKEIINPAGKHYHIGIW